MAAGLGFKDFTTGEVLTAADVDGYLMQGVWVFASAAARSAAVTSPQEGNYSFLKDTNSTEYYDGSAWVSAAPAATGGLTLIQTTSFSAVAGQIINNVFSSTYDNYRIVFTATAASALTLNMKMRVSGSDDSSANYTTQDLFANNTTVSASRTSGATSWGIVVVRSTLLTPMSFDIFNPNKASTTVVLGKAVDIGDPALRENMLIHNVNTAYDGFNLICSTSNMTGAVSIYGYNK
jgi:hypothetical protein